MRTKAQISIEFMVVFSFVLIVFVLLFSLITNQRAVETNTQTFAQVQLVAQNIALQISRAAQAGNGFSTRVLLSSSISSLPFNVSVTQSGLVVVTASVAKQVIRTTAYSGVPLISSNPSFLSSISATNKIYNLPTANGSIYLQNSFGTVCVDYACPTSSNQSSSVSLSMQDVHAALFNGQNTYLETSRGFNSMNVAAQPYSFSLWVYPTASNGVLINELWQQSPTGTGHTPLLEIVSGNLWMYGAGEGTCKYLGPIATNRWTHVAETYNGATLTGYVNGTLIATASFTRSVDPTPTSQFYTLGYPNTANCGSGLPFTGEVANYQFYNVTLSGVQVKSLYNTGIGAPPLTSNGLLIWWPLNGNANDYSGNGASGSSNGPVTFPGVAQLFATVLNSVGQPLYNVTVGFTTTLGNFTNGKGTQREQTNYTNANGVATVFLNQVGNNGQALVQATAFNGNFIPNANVIAWYPLNQGQGTQVADLSGNKDYGSFTPHYNTFFPAGAVFPFWNSPNYVANFYGKASFGPQFNQQNGYVSIPTSNELNVTTAVTITGWEYVKNYSNPYATIASKANTVGSYNYAFGTCGTTGALGFYGSGITPSPGWYCANSIGLTNQWNFVSVSYNGVAIQFYLNGVPAGTFSGLGGSLTKSAGPLTIG
ncbi:MAG: LamG domain-containing protein, partial [Candidatus Micrarchaeota archaeon]|nr:LamG domain-containing protein [Candidatus Micrarchaeota archaeon]